MILKTKEIKPIAEDPKALGMDNTVDRADSGNEIGRAKPQIDSQVKLSKSKHKIRSSLARSQLLAEPSSGYNFQTSKARLLFAELRQMFIETPILYYFDSKCHIWFETEALRSAIGEVLKMVKSKLQSGSSGTFLGTLGSFSLDIDLFVVLSTFFISIIVLGTFFFSISCGMLIF